MEITGAELVMVARGGLGNPTLITNINNRLEGKEELPAPTIAEQTEWALKFSEALIAEKGERVAIMELRGLIPHFFNGFPGYKKIRAEISVNIKTKEDLFRILNGILNRNRL
jgi:tRNA-dihydrouridine synthase